MHNVARLAGLRLGVSSTCARGIKKGSVAAHAQSASGALFMLRRHGKYSQTKCSRVLGDEKHAAFETSKAACQQTLGSEGLVKM
jgi:hypothetical protein